MKKVLALFMAICLMVSVFAVSTVATGSEGKNYYVAAAGSADGNGSENAPFLTITQAVEKAIAEGATAQETVSVTVLDDGVAGADTVAYGTAVSHDFRLAVKSQTERAKITFINNQPLSGDTDFYNVELLPGGSWPTRNLYLDGKDVTFDKDTVFSGDYLIFGQKEVDDSYDGQFVKYNASNAPGHIIAGNYTYQTVTYQKDLNFIFDGIADGMQFWITGNYGSTIYKSNLNMVIENTSVFNFRDRSNWNIEGALQIVCNEELTISGTLFDTKAPQKGIYKIINASGISNPIGFAEGEAGKYRVLADTSLYTFSLADENGNTYKMKLDETDGNYYISVPAAGDYTLTASIKSPITIRFIFSRERPMAMVQLLNLLVILARL